MKRLERVKGIEPSYSAWKAAALPLSYTRDRDDPLTRSEAGLNHRPQGTKSGQKPAALNRRRLPAYIGVSINNERR
jgi:hypothetical protein